MTKYSTDFKQRVVQYHEQHGGGTKRTATHFGIDRSGVRKWFAAYQQHGHSGLIRQPSHYSAQFKLQVLQTMDEKHWSIRQTCAFFNIQAFSTLRTWQRLYNEGGADALIHRPRGRPMSRSKKSLPSEPKPLASLTPEEMQEELEYLRAENAYLKKREALIQAKRSAAKKKR